MVFKLGEAWVDLLHGFEQKKSRMDIGGKSLFIRGILSISSFTLLFKITSSINISIIGMAIVTIGYILTYDMYFVRGFADVKPYITVRRFKELTFEFLPLTLAGLMSTAGMTFPRQLLENYSGTEILGIYATVATPAVIVQVAATYVFNPLLTLFAIYNAENRKRDFGKLFLKTSVVLCVISLVALGGCKIFGKWGLTFLYGEQIGKYSYLLIPVMLFTALNGFVWFLWNILIVLRKLKELFVVNFLGLFVCILFMKGFIQKYGMNGVSYVLILYTFLLILMMLSVLYVNMKKCKSNNH
ncbi:MAG: lipopolysaccharide biosynthesis protein [Lachnospiraceae bacterium]